MARFLQRGSSRRPSFRGGVGGVDVGGSLTETHVPCDFRLYEKDGKTKNEHFREILDRASNGKMVSAIRVTPWVIFLIHLTPWKISRSGGFFYLYFGFQGYATS